MKRKKVNEIVYVAVDDGGGTWPRYTASKSKITTTERADLYVPRDYHPLRIAKCRLVEITKKRKVRRGS